MTETTIIRKLTELKEKMNSCSKFEIISSVDSIIAELGNSIHESIAKSSGKKDVYKAFMNVLKRAKKSCYSKIQGIHKGLDFYEVCDSYVGIRLNNISVPETELIKDYVNLQPIFDGAKKNKNFLEVLPTVEELKAIIKIQKAKKDIKAICISEKLNLWVNPVYLLDVLQALPDAKAYAADRNISTIYFESIDGEAILCPVRPADK